MNHKHKALIEFYGIDVVTRTRMRSAVGTTFLRMYQMQDTVRDGKNMLKWLTMFDSNCAIGVTDPAFKDSITC